MNKAFDKIIKSQVRLTILSVIAVILVGIGSTYALFTTTHRNTTNQTISIGEIQAGVTGGTPITLLDIYPTSEGELSNNIPTYTFTITNPSGENYYAANYVLYLTDVTSDIIETSPYNTYAAVTSDYYNNIMVKYDNNPGVSLGSIYDSTVGGFVIRNGFIDLGDSENHTLKFWLSASAPNDMQGRVISLKLVMTAIATNNLDGANSPKLVNNLIPVVYNETTSKWQMSSTAFGEWYNYREQKWANAVTVTSVKRGTYSIGDTIEMDDILGMWVWIPRFEYKYTNLGTNYAGGTQAQPGAIDINFINGTSITESVGYIIHPAFRNGSVTYTNNVYTTTTAYQMGGWDSELTGFWMGKFETSSLANASNETSSIDSDPIVKPNVIARRYQTVNDQYETILNVKTYHGISTMDSHMSKNSEWGAVAYLSQSIYGKYGNSDFSGANKEIYINNSTSYYTGRSMGIPAGATGNSQTADGSYQYNNGINGKGASTTGTIYGIYDMVGGSWEYQMGWLNTASTNFGYRNNSGTDTNSAGFNGAPSNHRYYEEYTTTNISTACGGIACYGQILSEIAGWYGDYINNVSDEYPWIRGGSPLSYTDSSTGGLFSLRNGTGQSSNNSCGRAILV